MEVEAVYLPGLQPIWRRHHATANQCGAESSEEALGFGNGTHVVREDGAYGHPADGLVVQLRQRRRHLLTRLRRSAAAARFRSSLVPGAKK